MCGVGGDACRMRDGGVRDHPGHLGPARARRRGRRSGLDEWPGDSSRWRAACDRLRVCERWLCAGRRRRSDECGRSGIRERGEHRLLIRRLLVGWRGVVVLRQRRQHRLVVFRQQRLLVFEQREQHLVLGKWRVLILREHRLVVGQRQFQRRRRIVGRSGSSGASSGSGSSSGSGVTSCCTGLNAGTECCQYGEASCVDAGQTWVNTGTGCSPGNTNGAVTDPSCVGTIVVCQ